MKNLSDMHFHLDGYPNHNQIYSQINELKQYTLCVTNSSKVFNACKSTYSETNYVRFALGSHPLFDKDFDIKDFARYIDQTKYIGEVGLDFSKASQNNQNEQIIRFSSILDLIEGGGKIVSVHSNSAEKEIIDLISKHSRKNKYIMHWFCGEENDLKSLINLGCFFSININQVKKRPHIIKLIPKDKLLIESDGPTGSFIKMRYTPVMLREIYNMVSRVLNYSVEEQIFQNFKKLLS